MATHDPWLARGLVPGPKAVRAAKYIKTLRRDPMKVAEACGVEHPGLIDAASVEILDGRTGSTPLHEVYGYRPEWGSRRGPDPGTCVYGTCTARIAVVRTLPL